MDIKAAIRLSRMSRFQKLIVVTCLGVIAVDGFDVFAMGFVLPHLPAGFASSNSVKGYLLSAGLAGMAVGSFSLAPVADRFGRRRLVLASLLITLLGVVLSGLSPNVEALILARLLTGIGIGGLVPSLLVIIQEYSSDRRRGLVMGIYLTGMPLGSLVGGAIGTYIVALSGGAWQSMFYFGAALTACAFVAVYMLVPESIDFLITKGGERSYDELASIAKRLDNPNIVLDAPATAPIAPASSRASSILKDVFSGGAYRITLLLWLVQGLLMAAWYFINTWTPQLIKTASGNTDLGTTAGLALSLGGILGSLIFGLLSMRANTGRLMWTFLVGAAVSIVAFASAFAHIVLAVVLTVAVGLTVNAALTAVATVAPNLYPARSRATGTGWFLGVGRVCSILAPILVGYALATLSPQQIYYLAAVPMVVAAAAAHRLSRFLRTINGHEPTSSIVVEEDASEVGVQR